MKDRITLAISESIRVKLKIIDDGLLISQLEKLAKTCLAALRSGGKIIFAGNGGSFADAQHLSAEFTSRLMFDRAPLSSIALGTNSSSMTAIGNDYGYADIFARELQCIAKKNDVFIGISTSGNSPNIKNAVVTALELGIETVVWTGASGGALANICECFHIPSTETARVQECHITLGHVLCQLVEESYFHNL